jgi:protein farnesyltransferase subunit beta
MKQKDGGFTVCEGGEEDIRGAYCAATILSLLNLPLELPPDSPARVKGDETFLTGLGEWISRTQSFEGGIAGSPTNEGHGAYAFCALACLSLIGPPAETIPK